jgi:HipA-like C-terminal domain/HTH domain
MARPVQLSRETLITTMQARGPISATDLAAALGVNRTTIVRAIEEFGPRITVFGATRSTRYAVRRPVRNAGDHWPVYRIGASGHARPWAVVESLHARHWRLVWAESPPAWADRFSDRQGLWDGYPFFLSDLRPQGFIGRGIARQISAMLRVPDNPMVWTDEDTAVCLQAAGEDLPGDLVVGDDGLRRALQRALVPQVEDLTARSDRAVRYPELASRATNVKPGSSAGGEQPKFLTTLSDEAGSMAAVLVKFTAPLDQPTGQRWADLLLAEWHAHQVLAEQGLALSGAEILDLSGRRFLEVPRFDRTASGGRRGVVTLAALHDSAIGRSANHWPTAVQELQAAGLTDHASLTTTRRLHAFGELIGNTDMHHGNLAFWMDDALPFLLAPSYDMLPMLWSPGPQGEIIERQFNPAPPLPAEQETWQEAAAWATIYWQRLAADPRLSPAFARIASSADAIVQRLRSRVG